ncbi:hypothetical protein CKO21_01980 [Rhodovibrio salinarum]|uniref:DUF218 domain-containing protein n=2 Tax=Rhodovibrio salinarum TaxID=1087 RepID=A0A934UYP3_9PROT|nr:hypothetical protein [Rhodovibrio salinarum]
MDAMDWKSLLLPPGGLFLFAGALFLGARVLGVGARWPAAISIAIAYLTCTPIVGDTALSWHQTAPPLSADSLRPDPNGPGAVVILSAGLRSWTDGPAQPRLDSLSTTRLLYGAELAERTGLPVLVTGGPWGDDNRPIAREMAAFLRHWSNAEVRWVEAQARNTWENGRYSARLLEQAGIERVFLVTHAWHMPRAAHAFRAHGLDIVPAPTGFIAPPGPSFHSLLPQPSGLQTSYWALHELLGRIYYRWARDADGG